MDALVTLFSYIYKCFLRGEVAALIDMEGAFDNVNPNVLLQEIRHIGIPARTRKFIANLVFERIFLSSKAI